MPKYFLLFLNHSAGAGPAPPGPAASSQREGDPLWASPFHDAPVSENNKTVKPLTRIKRWTKEAHILAALPSNGHQS